MNFFTSPRFPSELRQQNNQILDSKGWFSTCTLYIYGLENVVNLWILARQLRKALTFGFYTMFASEYPIDHDFGTKNSPQFTNFSIQNRGPNPKSIDQSGYAVSRHPGRDE